MDDLTRRLMREHRVRQGLTPDPTEEELAGYRADAEARRQRDQADAEARETERVQRRQQYLHDNGFADEDEHEQFMGRMDRDHDDIADHWRRGHREEYDEGGDWHGDEPIMREHLASDHMIPNPDTRAAAHPHGLAGLHWQHHVTNRENAHPMGLSGQWRPIPAARSADEQALMDHLNGGRAEGETLDAFRHTPVQPYQAAPQDYDQMQQHLIEHHGYTPEMHMPRNLPGAQSVHRGLHLPGPIPLPEHQHDNPDDHHDPVFGSLEAPVSDGRDVVAHFEAARDDGYGHFAFYSGHDRDDVEPRTIELEDHLRGDHAYGNWHMDRDLDQARSSAYAGDGTNAAHWRQYHRNMDVLHRQAHDRALDDARSAIEHGAPESHVEDTRRELESAHRPQQDAENEERRAHDEAVAEHREQGSVQMHGNRVEFGEMEAHLREAHGIPHDALPEYHLPTYTHGPDRYESDLEEAHNQAHGEMGSYRHNDEGDWINMHGQPTGAWDAEHHLVQHHGFDLDDLRREEPSFDEMERQHAENHERDRRFLTHHLADEMDEEGHLPHHEWGEHDEEQYQATGQIPGYRGQQAQLGEYRHHPDYGELEAPGEEPDVHDTAFSYRHQPYQAAPRSHEDLWGHLREQHGITQSGDTSRMPAQHFLHEVHDKLHHGDEGSAQAHQERWTPHQHDEPEGHHDPVFGSRQAAELVGHFAATDCRKVPRMTIDTRSADRVLQPATRFYDGFFEGVANWSPQSPAEAAELFTDLPGFFDAVCEGLLSVAGHLDDAPVDEAMPDALRHMAGVVLNVAEDARLLASRLEEAGPEGMWETPKA